MGQGDPGEQHQARVTLAVEIFHKFRSANLALFGTANTQG
jgi:hypothetical protein